MSSQQTLSLILAELQANRAEMLSLKAEISRLQAAAAAPAAPIKTSALKAAGGGAAAAEAPKKAAKKERDPDAPKRAPTAWRLFADRVRELLRENGYTGSAIGVDCVQFCSTLKSENADFATWSDADILARREAWVKPEISKQSAAGNHWKNGKKVTSASSVESDGAAAPAEEKPKKERKNPWAGMTEEQRAERIAKMQAGREAKKAASVVSDAEDAPAPAPAALVVAEPDGAASVTSSEKKKRGPKKFADMTPEELAADKAKRAAKKAAKKAAAESAAAAVAAPVALAALPALPASPKSTVSEGYQRIMLGGKPYLVNIATGHCYHRLADGGQGEWAGLFHKTPKPHIDDSVPEPREFTDLDELD
jgi:hypothetical protein